MANWIFLVSYWGFWFFKNGIRYLKLPALSKVFLAYLWLILWKRKKKAMWSTRKKELKIHLSDLGDAERKHDENNIQSNHLSRELSDWAVDNRTLKKKCLTTVKLEQITIQASLPHHFAYPFGFLTVNAWQIDPPFVLFLCVYYEPLILNWV